MRLFIGINFNDDTGSGLLALRDELRGKSQRGNFSHPENLHLTPAFLGECDQKQLAAAKSAMDTVDFAPFDVTIEQIGNFRGDLWWAGCKATQQLLSVRRTLSDNLRQEGFALEKRRYSPHITLGRQVATDAMPWQIELFGETVSKIDLMKSERIGGKLTYTTIYTKRGTDR
jgi:2'-5' RNA ligase